MIAELLAELSRTLPVEGACWHETDPVTGIPVTSHREGAPAGDFRRSLDFEYEVPDVARFGDLAGRPGHVAVLSHETGGEPRRSPRFREMLEPAGAADELRASFADAFGVWGTLALFSRRRFTLEDAARVRAAVPGTAAALRARWSTTQAAEPPAVAVLDPRDRLVAADARTRALLAGLGGEGALPGAVHILAARARRREPARGMTRDAHGRWVALDVSTLDDEPHGSVAVVLSPAPRTSLLDAAFRARGLTAREREVAVLAVRGRSTREIAAELIVSPWTVQDHLKSVFEKCGVSRRSELAIL